MLEIKIIGLAIQNLIIMKLAPITKSFSAAFILPALGAMLFFVGTTTADEIVLERVESEAQNFRVVRVVDDLERPWAVEFLPGDRMLITERPGRMWLIENGARTEVEGLPEITARGQGGLMDVIKHPDFDNNNMIYFSYAAEYDGGLGTKVGRAILDGNQLVDFEEIFQMNRTRSGGPHYGCRLAWDDDGYLYVSIGDRGQRNESQNLGSHNGTLLRFREDGGIPDDNPFVGVEGALPEIYSYGHRNAQGLVFDSETGRIWQHEHGPRGGDTLNIIQRGANYGWPIATYGTEYRDASPIGEDPDEVEGIVYPVAVWKPVSIAPSGLILYRGDRYPEWEGDLFIGALRQKHIRRVVVDDDEVVHQEELLKDQVGRIRELAIGPDGYIYFATDESPGGVYRIEPLD